MDHRDIREDQDDSQRRSGRPVPRLGRLLERLGLLLGRIIERLGWFYLLAIVAGIASLAMFAWIADSVLERQLAPLNEEIMLGIHRFAGERWDPVARVVTDLGSVIWVMAVGIVAGALFLYRRRTLDAATLVFVLVGGGALSMSLKLFFQQERPRLFPTIIPTPGDYSFPSGHSLISFCLYGFFAVWLIVGAPREVWRWPVALSLVGLAALVAFSRLYLGVHWPTDVTAGMLVAAFWVTVCFSGRQWWIERSEARGERGGETS